MIQCRRHIGRGAVLAYAYRTLEDGGFACGVAKRVGDEEHVDGFFGVVWAGGGEVEGGLGGDDVVGLVSAVESAGVCWG
jgi:hypothetical protein